MTGRMTVHCITPVPLGFMLFASWVTHAEINFSSQNLTSVPFDNVSDSVTFLNLKNNQISAVEWFPPYRSIEKIDLGKNKLSEVPDFRNISCTLRALVLKHNNISFIDKERLIILNLTNLILGDNRINIFPDMPSPWGNYIKVIGLKRNPLITLPDIPALNANATVNLGGNKITCNCKLRKSIWRNTEGGECHKPSQIGFKELAQEEWENHCKC